MNESLAFTILFIVLVSYGGWKTKNLSISGSISAFVFGLILTFSYDWKALLLVGAFFLSSSIWSKLFSQSKEEIKGRLEKSSVRDWQQVLANGGPAAIFILLYYFTGEGVWLVSFGAAIAAANSDTWASEIGPLSSDPPFSLRSFKRVEKGTSGAVSYIGTLAAFTGSSFIAILFMVLIGPFEWGIFLLISAAGFVGNLIDTVAGAYVQVEFTCPVCNGKTEATSHCGTKTVKSKGIGWVDNESVNFASSLLAGLSILPFYSL
ncbi:DUF92 domain-containing protein [Rossellomorea aquimaris]|uniref:DUF92 domain-containing protein n=1 Tax=Rossellomorea aquimaris TaxID=189382 RepID=UPI001CD2CB71|nr:DUF92 domain-containing protein [Rossellomorea aquimaris]MCA1054828.1 DUF92 domain-containing protein [Rossellomorea aquimaris]